MTLEQEIESVKKQIEFADYCIEMLKTSKLKKSEIVKTEEHRDKLQEYLVGLETQNQEESSNDE
jgi:hypothetical protein